MGKMTQASLGGRVGVDYLCLDDLCVHTQTVTATITSEVWALHVFAPVFVVIPCQDLSVCESK